LKTSFIIFLLFLLLIEYNAISQVAMEQNNENNKYKIEKNDNEWKGQLDSEEYRVLRQCGTEMPGTGKYYNFYEQGNYICAACGLILFDSGTKYSSGSGWPSFYDVFSSSNVVLLEDKSLNMKRTEVKCAGCGSHLGHVFPDGPKPTGLRYCINSVSMKFIDIKGTVQP